MSKPTAHSVAQSLATLATSPILVAATSQACAAASNVLGELAAMCERPELAAGMDAATLARVLLERSGLALPEGDAHAIRETARLAGFELGHNVAVNPGYYFYPAGSRDDAPRTWPTVAEAWTHARELYSVGA
jgi:hypothetical protein